MNKIFKYKSMCDFNINDYICDGFGYIYTITNIVTNQIYVGSAYEWKKRFRSHINTLNLNKHRNKFLQNSWNKYGMKNFKFNILLTIFDKKNINNIEQQYLDKFFLISEKNMFNINRFVDAGFKDRKHSKKTKQKMSEKRMGVSLTKGINNPNVKLKEFDVLKIRELYKTNNYTFSKLGKMYNITYTNISAIIKRKIWKEI